MPDGGVNVRVAEMIDWSVGCWRREALQNHFIQVDIDRICAIRLSLLTEEEKIIWQYESFGDYTVRSGYHILQNILSDKVNSTDKRVWTIIWSSQILKKTKIFIWRVFRRCLLVRAELARRCIVTDPLCPLCGVQDETEVHVLFKCKEVAEVWRRRGLA